jgi:hypothetical protein
MNNKMQTTIPTINTSINPKKRKAQEVGISNSSSESMEEEKSSAGAGAEPPRKQLKRNSDEEQLYLT